MAPFFLQTGAPRFVAGIGRVAWFPLLFREIRGPLIRTCCLLWLRGCKTVDAFDSLIVGFERTRAASHHPHAYQYAHHTLNVRRDINP